ncbi:MAG: hypothetical protein BroJett040_21780 [Oligoflexia bacterium]|nr:MAG: hypothetical protein BroJett040_21780 [Oligoflexia bacterium]
MENSDGVFTIEIGKATNRTSGLTLLEYAFRNTGTYSSLTCVSGTSYTPAANDDRQMQVSFNDGSGTQQLSAMTIKSVPYSMYADKAGEANKVSGVEVSTATPANGQALVYNSATQKWEPQDIVSGTNVPSSVTAPAVGQDGQSLRWNNTTAQWEWFTPGVAGAGIATLNGQSGSAHNFAVSSTGTDFTISSASNIHTFNFPNASATARGLLSSTDWSTFNNKQAQGNYITALTGDIAASGPGSAAATIANDAVNSAKILDGSVGVGDLSFAGAMAINSGLVVRNGTQFFNKSCAGNEALIWTVANGWICSAVVLTESDPGVSAWAKNASLQAADVPNLDAAKITTGTLGTARLGSGTADSTKYLRGDGSWQTLPSGADNLGNHTASSNLVMGANWISGDGGNEGIRVDNSGNVGMGVASPLGNLHVYGGTGASMIIDRPPGQYGTLHYRSSGVVRWSVATDTSAESGSNAGTNFSINRYDDAGNFLGSPLWITRSNGNVGIGTSSPGGNLEVSTSLNTNLRLRTTTNAVNQITSLSAYTGTGTSPSDFMGSIGYTITQTSPLQTSVTFRNNYGDNSNPYMTALANGNVGIGTSSPSQKLSVVDTALSRVLVQSTGTDSYASIALKNDSREWVIQNQGPDADKLYFYDQTAGQNRMAIDSSGNVGIGTNAPTERLDLGGGNIKMGYEIVTTNVTPGSAVGWYDATCPAGKYVTGGACTSSGGIAPTNTDLTNTSYRCYKSDMSTNWQIKAICMNVR